MSGVREVIHRDLKPANILMHKLVPKIADFGFAATKRSGAEVQFHPDTPVERTFTCAGAMGERATERDDGGMCMCMCVCARARARGAATRSARADRHARTSVGEGAL